MAFPTGWLRKCPLVVQHGQVPANQTAFPVLVAEVSLPAEMMTSGGGNAAQSDGGDIRFSSDSAGASQLACEVVLWTQNANPALAKAEIWVPVSVLTASDVTIYVWYSAGGGVTQPAANAAFGSQAVWDSNYKGVWHLPNGTVITANDSTSNANNETLSGATPPAATAGQIDGGGLFDGSTSYLTLTSTPSATLPFGNGNFTVSQWVRPTSFAAEKELYDTLVLGGAGARNNAILLVQVITSGKLRLFSQSGYSSSTTGALTINTWNHIAIVRVTTTVTFYINGSADATTVSSTTTDSSGGAVIGRYADVGGAFFAGSMDEIRASTTNRSANWITTEYNNQNAPSTFLIAGTAVPTTSGNLFSPPTLSGLGSGGPFFHNPLN